MLPPNFPLAGEFVALDRRFMHSKPKKQSDKPVAPPGGTRKTKGRKRQKRLKLTNEQLEVLESVFAANRYPSAKDCGDVASAVNLPHHSVRIWFQNRRARMKRASQSRFQTEYEIDLLFYRLYLSPPHFSHPLPFSTPSLLPLSHSLPNCFFLQPFLPTPVWAQHNTRRHGSTPTFFTFPLFLPSTFLFVPAFLFALTDFGCCVERERIHPRFWPSLLLLESMQRSCRPS